MEYICDKIIPVTKFEISNIYFLKLGLWMEFLGEIFNGVWYWYTLIKSINNLKFKILEEISFKKCVFFAFV
jgi:hypothetical protein